MKLEEFLKRINITYNNWNDYGYYQVANFSYNNQMISTIHINPNDESTYTLIKQGRKPDFIDKDFCVLGNEIYYQFLKDTLPEQERVKWFELTNDLAYNLELFETMVDKYDEKSFIHESFLRGTTAGYVATVLNNLTVNKPRNENYRVVISDSVETLFDVEIKQDSLLPTNVLGIIGRNGTGKTHFLQSLSHGLLVADNDSNKEITIKYFDNESREVNRSEILSNVLYISYSPFDEKIEIDDSRFKPLGLHASSKDISSIEKLNDNDFYEQELSEISNDFSKRIYISLIDLASPGNSKRFNYFKRIIDEYFALEEWAVNLLNILESIISEGKNGDSVGKQLNTFSSGQKIIVLSIVNIILEISANAFVIIDEPELFLHPGLLKAYINAITTVTKELNGLTFIATHNPIVLQEILGKGVRKTYYENGSYKSKSIGIETYGESISILNNAVFELDMKQTGFYEYITKLFENNLVSKDNYAELSDNLGSTGKILLEYQLEIDNYEKD